MKLVSLDLIRVCYRTDSNWILEFIRNRATRASRAVARIDCLLRWCLTGTPITNSLSDREQSPTFCFDY